MRVALVGWDTDDAVLDALASLGVEVVAWTRWFPEVPLQERMGGWLKERCPHELGGGPEAESRSFGESVRARLAEWSAASGWQGFDVVHALDRRAGLAAEALAERSTGCARVASVSALEIGSADPQTGRFRADRWIADHPWTAQRWRSRDPASAASVHLVPTSNLLAGVQAEVNRDQDPQWPLVVLVVPSGSKANPGACARALADVRTERPGLAALVLGAGEPADSFRSALAQSGLLAHEADPALDPAPHEGWAQWLVAAAVVAIASDHPADDPTAWAAWLLGAPVVSVEVSDANVLATALRAALGDRRRFEREVRAGAALARRCLAPAETAQGWLRTYLEAQIAGPAPARTVPDAPGPRPALAAGLRSRLTLVALGPQELYACWHVRRADHAAALQWLGADAVHATLTLRLHEIPAAGFTGSNPRATLDLELGRSERFRAIPTHEPGASFVASLGLRSPRGHFHALVHAGPVHLPRAEPTGNPPACRLRALPRRSNVKI
jgi:hypothetical protein